MNYTKIFQKKDEKYTRDILFENRIDTVVQHMLAAGFTKSEIMEMIGVTAEFVDACDVPGGWLAFV